MIKVQKLEYTKEKLKLYILQKKNFKYTND